LANNEFGLGKPTNLEGFNRYTKSMVVVEFALEMYVAGYDVAAFWDNSDGGSADHDDQMLFSSGADWRFNPMHIGLELLAESAGHQMLNTSSYYSNPNVHTDRVHGFAARDGDTNQLRVYLINKMESTMSVRINLPESSTDRGKFTVVSMVDTEDHWALRNVSALPVLCSGGACDVDLPQVSFTMLVSSSETLRET
jgi:hypothetical protein